MPVSSPEDDFNDIVEGLMLETPSDVLDVTTLQMSELAIKRSKIIDELTDRGEVMNPRTQRGRDLHSLLQAIRIEIGRRSGK